jgi:hypothetical protein
MINFKGFESELRTEACSDGCPRSALQPDVEAEVLMDADLDTLATALYVSSRPPSVQDATVCGAA